MGSRTRHAPGWGLLALRLCLCLCPCWWEALAEPTVQGTALAVPQVYHPQPEGEPGRRDGRGDVSVAPHELALSPRLIQETQVIQQQGTTQESQVAYKPQGAHESQGVRALKDAQDARIMRELLSGGGVRCAELPQGSSSLAVSISPFELSQFASNSRNLSMIWAASAADCWAKVTSHACSNGRGPGIAIFLTKGELCCAPWILDSGPSILDSGFWVLYEQMESRILVGPSSCPSVSSESRDHFHVNSWFYPSGHRMSFSLSMSSSPVSFITSPLPVATVPLPCRGVPGLQLLRKGSLHRPIRRHAPGSGAACRRVLASPTPHPPPCPLPQGHWHCGCEGGREGPLLLWAARGPGQGQRGLPGQGPSLPQLQRRTRALFCFCAIG